jgi:hypothetical protein
MQLAMEIFLTSSIVFCLCPPAVLSFCQLCICALFWFCVTRILHCICWVVGLAAVLFAGIFLVGVKCLARLRSLFYDLGGWNSVAGVTRYFRVAVATCVLVCYATFVAMAGAGRVTGAAHFITQDAFTMFLLLTLDIFCCGASLVFFRVCTSPDVVDVFLSNIDRKTHTLQVTLSDTLDKAKNVAAAKLGVTRADLDRMPPLFHNKIVLGSNGAPSIPRSKPVPLDDDNASSHTFPITLIMIWTRLRLRHCWCFMGTFRVLLRKSVTHER